MDSRLQKIYKPPFKHHMGYIHDVEGEMVADFRGPADTLRVRGWGRFKYMEKGEELHKAMEEFLIVLTAEHPLSPDKCVEALNQVWDEAK